MRHRVIQLLVVVTAVLVATIAAAVDWSPAALRDPARTLLLGPRESFAAAEGPFLPVFGPTELALFLGTGVAFVVSGAIAWNNRPHDLSGPLILMAGLLWFLGGLRRSGEPVAFTVGVAATNLYLPVLLQALIGFPTGRLHRRWQRLFVGAAWLLATIGIVAEWLFFDPRTAPAASPSTSTNLLLLRDNPSLAQAVQLVVGFCAFLIVGTLVLVVIVRWRSGSPAYRAGFAPLGVAYGLSAVITIVVLSSAVSLPWSPPPWVLNLRYPTTALFPLAVAVGLVRYRLARAAVSDAMVEIGSAPIGVGFVDALRRAVHDPSLVLWTYAPERAAYVDPDGSVHALPRRSDSRAATILERGGTPVGALVYDPSLETQPELLAAVHSATALALEHERLQADLQLRLDEVRRSRERIVAAGDIQRRRLERDLHDGAQQRLVAASLLLRRAQRAGEEADLRRLLADGAAELDTALTELRELARGVYPAVLTERGLAAALRSLAERAPVPVGIDDGLPGRPSPPVELAAYLIGAEAVTNAGKHSGATAVRICLHRAGDALRMTIRDDGCGGARPTPGGGLDGLRDRTEALGGDLVLDSPEGRGTTVDVTLPFHLDVES
ncbi:ATP-binding protein [Rhodococcus sp. DMU1]|uniref:sensor histidine kinase n=1 Tax=Rhodococcus sp. DMU1 TaxID=2722825 RepID=UPI00143E7F50|nr:ATP-binding protein [Rhodococcus sp. DMU1]QIX51240.1 sensor histidine kinase [Rhodococcus sp. DMU1]